VNKPFRSIVILCVASFLLACAGTPAKISTVTDVQGIDVSRGRKISASAAGFQLLLFIPISVNSRHERAYNALRAQAGNDVITDVTITESWSYGFVGTTYRTRIDASAYPRKEPMIPADVSP
jgi:hypothetical protein